jgi:hypothetical protein
MSYSEHNQNKRIEYWNNFNKTGKSHTLARCYYAVTKPKTLGDIFESIKNCMYARDSEERQKLGVNTVSLLLNNETEFIFNNRRLIRENFNQVSFSEHKLFCWMKVVNKDKYAEFKNSISVGLKNKALIGSLTPDEIKRDIAMEIYYYLSKYYLML